MSELSSEERRSWFPLVLAACFVAFALAAAFAAYLANREGRPEQAASVDDVAELAIEAVDKADRSFAGELACGGGPGAVASFVPSRSAVATKSEVKGGDTGSFVLTVDDAQWRVTVGRDGERSCIEQAVRTSRQ